MPSDDDVLLLVQELPMDMHMDDGGGQEHRLARLLPPLACAPGPPPFRPPPPPAAAASAESRVSFRGWLGAPRYWDLWVAKLRPIHERLWRRLGILDALLVSTYRFKRDASAVLHLASFWSPDTSTFAFPWGEATLSLQDVVVLGGFPAHGSPLPAPLPPQWRPDEAALNGVRLGFNRSACKKAHHSAWMKHFLTDTDADADIEHAAFLALWLTRFVLPGHPESTMRQSLFPLAIRLARGDRVALAPAVLASLYRDLREMKAYLVAVGGATTGGNAELLSSLSVHAPLYILQIWMWERFPLLWAGKANPIKDGEPRAARWHDVSKKMNPTVIREALNSGKNFVWRPYTSSVQAWKQHSGWVRGSDITENEELRSLAHCLHACELVGMDCIEQYLPHRVAMQFGLDQDVPCDVPRANEDWGVAWETYDLEGKNVAFFIPQSEPGVTARYAQWWTQPLPPSDLDVGAASIAVGGKVSKRKVKKTPAAMEAEAEKERKMKKARISPNDKKRKLEELYDAKLSDWLAAARNGSSGTSGGSCKRGSKPNSDTGSDKALLTSVETCKDDIVLLVPRKQAITPAVNLEKDKDMNLATGDKGNFKVSSSVGTKEKGVNLKGYMTVDLDHAVNQLNFKEKQAVVTTEISTFTEGAKDERSDMILKDTNELVSWETPDAPNRPEEVKPLVHMEKEEWSDRLSDVDCSEDAGEKIVTVDKLPDIPNEPEAGPTVTLEEKKLNLPEDKSLDVTDRSEERTSAMLELGKEDKIAVDEPCGPSNRSGEDTDPVMEEEEEKSAAEVTDEGKAVSAGAGRSAERTSCSVEVVVGSKQGVDGGVVSNPHDAVALPEEMLSFQQANHVGECVGMSCIMEDISVGARVLGENNGETTCDVVEEKREVSCVEEIGGGESNQMAEKDSKQKPQEAPQIDIVECGDDITLMDKDNEGEHEKVPQRVEEVVTDNNMAAVLLGVPEEKDADVDKALNLAKEDTEDMPKEVIEVYGAEQEQINTLAKGGAKEQHREVAELYYTYMADRKMHARFDTEKPEEAAEVGHAEMDEGKRLTGRDTDGKHGDVPEVGHSEVEKARELIENGNDEKLQEIYDVVHAETEEVKGLKEDTGKKFEEVSELENTGMDGTHGPVEEDTDGKLKEVSDLVHAEMEEVKGLMEEDTERKFEKVSELENTGMDGTHGPTEEDTDGKLKEIPEVNAEAKKANGLERDNYRPDVIWQVDLPARDEARCLAKEDTEDNTTKVPQVKHEKMRDDAPIEKDTKQKLNADGKDLSVKEIDESNEVFQVEQEEGEECKVLSEKDTDEKTRDALGVKQAENGQDKALTVKYTHGYIEEITLAEQVDGQSRSLIRVDIEENPEEITQAQEKEFDKDTIESSNNPINGEMLCSSASIQTKKYKKEVSVEGMMEKQCIQDIEFINESKTSSDGAAMKDEGVDDHKTLDRHEELATKQTQDCGIISENKETKILEDSHTIDGGLKPDLVIMEVDETQSTGGIQNQETLDLDKQQTMEERQDLGSTTENKKMIMSRDANMLGCSEFQADSPETKVNGVESTKGIQNQEHLDVKEEQVLEKGLECKITDGDGRSLEVTNTLGGGGVDTIAVAVHVNEASAVEGIQNRDSCSTEEANVKEDKQHHGVGDVNKKMILEYTNTIDCGESKSDAITVGVHGAESREATRNQLALSMEKELAAQEKQDEGMADENTKRILVGIDAPECGGAKPDGTMTRETLPSIQAVNVAGDKNTSENQQKGVVWEDHNESEKEPAVHEKDEWMADENTKIILVDSDAPQCGGVKPDGTMKMNHETLPTVLAINVAGDRISSKNQQKVVALGDHNISDVKGSESNQTARKDSKGAPPLELEHQVEVKQEIFETKTGLFIGGENGEAFEQDQSSTEECTIAPSSVDHRGEDNNEWAEESIRSYGKYASDPVNTGCQTSKFGRSSIEEVRRIHNGRSIFLNDIKESQGRIRSEPSNRIHTNNVGYYSWHGGQEPVSVSKDIKVPLHDSARVCGRDRALELVTGPLEDTSRWRQEQYALNILEDAQNARIAEKTRMEMEIRILKAQIASMQRQVMNLDHVGEVTSRSKRH